MRDERSFLALSLAVWCLSAAFAMAQTVEPGEIRYNERQPPAKVMDAVGVKPGMTIGEIGAGRGRYTVHLAVRVGAAGKVYANDIDASGLEHIRERCKKDGIANVETIVGKVDDPLFPKASLDMAFMILTYHHLSEPVALFKNLIPSLKPGATVVVVDPDPEKDKKRTLDETTPREKIEKETAAAGFEIARVETFLERDTIYVLRVSREQ